jgi:hypothetical protein
MPLLLKPSLVIGDIELNRMQKLQKEDLWDVLSGMIKEYGLYKNTNTGLTVWQVSKASDNSITIKAGHGIVQDEDGNPVIIRLKNDTTLNVPATYKILVKHKKHNYEQGTVTLTNSSKIISGVNTEFLSVIGPDRQLIVNGIAYPVELVSSNTSLQLYSAYTGATSTGNQYSVGGKFATIPETVNDRLIYEHDGVEVLITTAAKGDYEYWLAEVSVVSTVISTVTDKRDLNLMSFDVQNTMEIVIPHTWTISGDAAVATGDIDYLNPFFISAPSGQTVSLIALSCKTNSGNCNFKMIKIIEGAQSDIAGFTNIEASTAINTINPDDYNLDNFALIKPIINTSNSGKNLVITGFFKYKIGS